MKISLLIATSDDDYTEHLSNLLSDKYKDTFFVSVCSSSQSLTDLLLVSDFDAALLETQLIRDTDISPIKMPLLLWDESDSGSAAQKNHTIIRKYQRVSAIASSILEYYASFSAGEGAPDAGKASITAVWSPCGGVGKTTVALANAIKASLSGKKALYLNMEHFSSSPAYFNDSGRSISSVFEMLERNEDNLKMLIQAILRQDPNTGVSYFCHPENFDDMNILSVDDIAALITACAGFADELVIDLSSACNIRTRQVFKLADRVLLVTDHTSTSQAKLRQFVSQHSVFEQFKAKVVLVANMCSSFSEPGFDEVVTLPLIKSTDSPSVAKSLSGCSFEPTLTNDT